MKYTCPVCGYLVFANQPGSDELCPICGWQDDAFQLKFPLDGGANEVGLLQAQKNFAQLGAVEERLIPKVRRPNENDKKNPNWRPFNKDLDKIERPIEGQDYLEAYPMGLGTRLYYWEELSE